MFHLFHRRVQWETLLVCFGAACCGLVWGVLLLVLLCLFLGWVSGSSLTNMQSLHPSFDDLCTPHTWRPNSCKKKVRSEGSKPASSLAAHKYGHILAEIIFDPKRLSSLPLRLERAVEMLCHQHCPLRHVWTYAGHGSGLQGISLDRVLHSIAV